MQAPLIIGYYIRWHYTQAFVDIARLHGNFLWFVYNHFSMPTLARTLLDPWKRLSEDDRGKSRVASFFSNLIINTFMRVIGLVARSVTLVVGSLVFVGVLCGGILFYVLWIVIPLVAVGFLVIGLNRIIH